MPTVPTVQGRGVELRGLPDAYQRAPQAVGEVGQIGARRQWAQAAEFAGAAAEPRLLDGQDGEG